MDVMGGLVNGNDFDGHVINATNLTGGMSIGRQGGLQGVQAPLPKTALL
ncbi:hypothetical protein J4E08_15640 [Sagittula sp. NFXS13]